MIWVVVIAVVWMAVGIPVGMFVGAMIWRRDQRG